ncbi:MAG: fibronectin type III domain-containing protein [Streptomyces sp.]|uniref:beta strand repeat-containing protein n=1 Tax=Streptomyces sp. TaxID=1931 RepID=UPI0025D4574F|nr:fibronectin type III domain-containing protein [Streptomyces sp.]MBW8792614.1 fibronectin type III domain-containing protein [Streptomyces sp.]
MRLAARRLIAATGVTALVAAGGIALAPAASAEALASVNPTGTTNDGVKSFTVTSSSTQFYPSAQDTVTLTRTPPVTGQPVIDGTMIATGTCTGGVPVLGTDGDCGTTLTFKADLANAAPGSYAINVTGTAGFPGDTDRTFTGGTTVADTSNPTVDGSALWAGTTNPPDGQLTITGSHLSKGSTVSFLKADGSPEDHMSFVPNVDGGTANGYINSTTLRGTYSKDPSATVGVHHIKVTNAVGQAGTEVASFYQPAVTGTTPASLVIGQGASAVPFTFTGPAANTFNPTTTLFVPASGGGTAATDVTASNQVVNVTKDVFTTDVSATNAAVTGTRNLTLRGADGGFVTLANALTINPAPSIASISPSTRGQGYAGTVDITGSNLSTTSVFDFGDGIDVTAPSAIAGGVRVTLAIDPDTALGARSVTVTNADHGTSTKSNAFTVTQNPVVTSVLPASASRGTTDADVTFNGSGFQAGATVTASGTGVTFSSISGSGSTLTGKVTVAGDAAYGPRDVTVTNPDGGTSTCTGCFGVRNLDVLTPLVSNAHAQDVTVAPAAGEPALTLQSTVTAYLPGVSDQGALPGVVKTLSGGQLTVTFPLTNAAVGYYTVQTSTPTADPESPTVLTCTGCLRVIANSTPTGLTVAPTSAGQGALQKSVTITGTDGIYPGQTVSFSGSGITVESTTFSAGHLTAVIDIAEGAATGARDVIVTNSDGTSGTKAGGFTVNAGPKVTNAAPSSLGQGGTADITLTGTGFTPTSTVKIAGTDITATVVQSAAPTATSMKVTVTLGDDTEVGTHDITVVNPDGGRGTLSDGLTVTPAPVITAITPAKAPRGTTDLPVTITGTGFAKSGEQLPAITPSNQLSITITDVSADGTQLTGTLTVPSTATDGKKTVQVTNPDGGSSRFGDSVDEAGFLVATPPTAPSTVAATAGDTKVLVAWSPGTPGGSTITEYTVQRYTSGGVPIDTKVVAAPNRQVLFSGLTNGTTYRFKVKAKNTTGGYGEYSTATGVATPKYATRLTSTSTPRATTSGSSVTYSGKLTRVTGGAGLAGVTVKLTLVPAVGSAHTYATTTRSDGTWRLGPAAAVYNTSVRTSALATAVNAAASAPTYSVSVGTRITITSPRSGSSSGATTLLVIRGATSPNKAGHTIGLFRRYADGYHGVASAKIASNGTYVFSIRLPRGSYSLKTGLGAMSGNAAGFSPVIVVTRT